LPAESLCHVIGRLDVQADATDTAFLEGRVLDEFVEFHEGVDVPEFSGLDLHRGLHLLSLLGMSLSAAYAVGDQAVP